MLFWDVLTILPIVSMLNCPCSILTPCIWQHEPKQVARSATETGCVQTPSISIPRAGVPCTPHEVPPHMRGHTGKRGHLPSCGISATMFRGNSNSTRALRRWEVANNLLSIKSHIYLGSLYAEFCVTSEIYLPYFPEIYFKCDIYLGNVGDRCHKMTPAKTRQKCQYNFDTECRIIFKRIDTEDYFSLYYEDHLLHIHVSFTYSLAQILHEREG